MYVYRLKNNSTEQVASMYASTTQKMLNLVERNRIPLGYGKYREWEMRIAEGVLIHSEQALSNTLQDVQNSSVPTHQ